MSLRIYRSQRVRLQILKQLHVPRRVSLEGGNAFCQGMRGWLEVQQLSQQRSKACLDQELPVRSISVQVSSACTFAGRAATSSNEPTNFLHSVHLPAECTHVRNVQEKPCPLLVVEAKSISYSLLFKFYMPTHCCTPKLSFYFIVQFNENKMWLPWVSFCGS